MTQPPRHEGEREIIVTERSSGAGVILGVILAIVAVVFVVWLIFGLDGEGGGEADVVPDDVNVTVDVQDGGGEGGG